MELNSVYLVTLNNGREAVITEYQLLRLALIITQEDLKLPDTDWDWQPIYPDKMLVHTPRGHYLINPNGDCSFQPLHA